jgi:hypothetical protein
MSAAAAKSVSDRSLTSGEIQASAMVHSALEGVGVRIVFVNHAHGTVYYPEMRHLPVHTPKGEERPDLVALDDREGHVPELLVMEAKHADSWREALVKIRAFGQFESHLRDLSDYRKGTVRRGILINRMPANWTKATPAERADVWWILDEGTVWIGPKAPRAIRDAAASSGLLARRFS